MIKVTEKHYKKLVKISNFKTLGSHSYQYRVRTTYWLLWVLPICIIDKAVSGDFEMG